MTNTHKTVKALIKYYEENRQVGHTNLILRGLNNTDNALVVVRLDANRRPLENRCSGKNKTICLGGLKDELPKHDLPIVFDNDALYSLLRDIDKQLETL